MSHPRSLYSRAYYLKNRDRILAYCKRYGMTHTDEIRERGVKWRIENREYHLAQKRKYHHQNKERIRAAKREYYLKNREYIKLKTSAYAKSHPEVPAHTGAKRRALKRGTQVNPKGIREWMRWVRSKPFAKCYWCESAVTGRRINFDHIIPLNRGGHHTISNLCVSCQDCNFSKHDRLLSEWHRLGQMFLEL